MKKEARRRSRVRIPSAPQMLETHPFGIFCPPKARYFLLGSFTTKEAYDDKKKLSYVWFYSNGRNQFWPILESVYGIKLQTRKEMQELFTSLRMALGDIIYKCERKNNSNLDINLSNAVYNIKPIENVLKSNKIKTIFFSSRFVETRFRKVFKHLIEQFPSTNLITLPSPSPRYVLVTKDKKIRKYKELLPKLLSLG